MAQDRNDLKNMFPIPVYTFRVQIGAETYGFSQVTGLNIQYDTITYKHGLSVQEGVHYMPGQLQPINVTLQKGVVRSGSLLLEWISSIRLNKAKKMNIVIDLCDEAGDPLVSWMVLKAFPISMEAPTFDANNNEVAIESLQLMASGLRISYHGVDQTGGTQGSGILGNLTSFLNVDRFF